MNTELQQHASCNNKIDESKSNNTVGTIMKDVSNKNIIDYSIDKRIKDDDDINSSVPTVSTISMSGSSSTFGRESLLDNNDNDVSKLVMPAEKNSIDESSSSSNNNNIFTQNMIMLKQMMDNGNNNHFDIDKVKEIYHSTMADNAVNNKPVPVNATADTTNDDDDHQITDTQIIIISISKLLLKNKHRIDMNDPELMSIQESLLCTTMKSQRRLDKVLGQLSEHNLMEEHNDGDCDDMNSLCSSILFDEMIKDKTITREIINEKNEEALEVTLAAKEQTTSVDDLFEGEVEPEKVESSILFKEMMKEIEEKGLLYEEMMMYKSKNKECDCDVSVDCEYETHTPRQRSNSSRRGSIFNVPSVFYTGVQNQAIRIAKYPKLHFWTSFLIIVIFSAIGLVYGDFSIDADNKGWSSRGTTISDRYTQIILVAINKESLFYDDNGEQWDNLLGSVQQGWEIAGRVLIEEKEDEGFDYSSYSNNDTTTAMHTDSVDVDDSIRSSLQIESNDYDDNDHTQNQKQLLSFLVNRSLQDTNTMEESNDNNPEDKSYLLTCQWDWYTDGRLERGTNLWPIWKVKDKEATSYNDDDNNSSPASALDSEVIRDICITEQNTLQYLEENDLCFGCPNGRCLLPYSIVFYVRLVIDGGIFMDCNTLADKWANTPSYKEATENDWKTCVEDIQNYGIIWRRLPESCGQAFYPSILDTLFYTNGAITYTSSIFPSQRGKVGNLIEHENNFDHGGNLIEGVYDTTDQTMQAQFQDQSLLGDILLGMASSAITILAILVHTKSTFLTIVGVLEIMFSFPMAYFVYSFIFGIKFFPFLNFISIFVIFALGADHIFVAVDKWKNARIKYPLATTEQIAAIALPDAAGAMFLTTLTTSVAFFATGICRVAPIRVFGIFCGLLVIMDYTIDILLIFPCLCIYDRSRGKKSYFMGHFSPSYTNEDTSGNATGTTNNIDIEQQEIISSASGGYGVKKEPFIHRVLLGYYSFLHRFRWILLLASLSATGVCGYYATKLELPSTSEVTFLPDYVDFQKHSNWKKNLLIEELRYKASYGRSYITWGTQAADTGNMNNPNTFSQLVLDERFDPSTQNAQIFLRDFCSSLFKEDFAMKSRPDYECPINIFDKWLSEQSERYNDWIDESFATPLFVYPDGAYVDHCANANKLPISPDIFHPCIIGWSKVYGLDSLILQKDGIVKLMYMHFIGRTNMESPNRVLHDEYNLIDNWMQSKTSDAPVEVSGFIFGAGPFWNYDTQNQMFQTAHSSIITAICASALVILLYSRSIAMTVFSVISITYVLASVTAILTGMGWSLGFLESICFSILIGISVDFVIHFSHSYTSLPGDVSRNVRTKYALLHMGPSILAAAFTTIASSVVMFFTVILFFQKFGIILFLAVLQATIGSFVVFLTLTDCFGPSNPTYTVDRIVEFIVAMIYGGDERNFYTQGRYSMGMFSKRSSKVSTASASQHQIPNDSISIIDGSSSHSLTGSYHSRSIASKEVYRAQYYSSRPKSCLKGSATENTTL